MKKKTLNYFLYSLAIKYPTHPNLNYNYIWRLLAFICLAIQILSGILLVMFYVPEMSMAFNSIARLMIDVEYGWLLRYLHANVASFFFVIVYLHMARALFYGSYKKPRQFLWNSGIVILFLLIIIAFLGYTPPWGQMSFWGATVITNFVSISPIIGYDVLEWLWGGLTVGNATLGRFFSLHYFFPFLILGVVIAHLYKLHNVGSSNPIGTNYSSDKGFFGPYFLLKDTFTVFIFIICFCIILGYITPEGFFLVFYAIPRVVFLFLCYILVCFSINLFTTFMINSLKTLFESTFKKSIEIISKNTFLSYLTFYFCAFVTSLRAIVGKESILVPIIPIGLSTFLAGMFLIGYISKFSIVLILMVTATQLINLDIWGHLFACYLINNNTSLFAVNYFTFVTARIASYNNKPFKRQVWSYARHVFMGSSGLIPIGRATILAGAMTGSAILVDGELNRRHASDEAMKQRKFEAWKMEYHTWESFSAKYGEPAPKPPIK